MITEEPHRLMAEGVLIADVVCLVDNDQIKAWGWVQLQQSFSAFPLAGGPRAVQEDLIEQGVGNNHSLVLLGPDPVQVHLVDAVPQCAAVEMREAFFKSFHLPLPLPLRYQ